MFHLTEKVPSPREGLDRGTGQPRTIEMAKLGDVELAVEKLNYLTSKLMKFGLDADISMLHMGWDEKVEKTVSDFHDVSFLLELEKTAIEEDWNDCMRTGAMKVYTRFKRGKM